MAMNTFEENNAAVGVCTVMCWKLQSLKMYGTGTRIDQWSGIESIGTVKNIDIYTYIYIYTHLV